MLFSEFPTELHLQVFQYCDNASITSLLLVNRHMNEICMLSSSYLLFSMLRAMNNNRYNRPQKTTYCEEHQLLTSEYKNSINLAENLNREYFTLTMSMKDWYFKCNNILLEIAYFSYRGSDINKEQMFADFFLDSCKYTVFNAILSSATTISVTVGKEQKAERKIEFTPQQELRATFTQEFLANMRFKLTTIKCPIPIHDIFVVCLYTEDFNLTRQVLLNKDQFVCCRKCERRINHHLTLCVRYLLCENHIFLSEIDKKIRDANTHLLTNACADVDKSIIDTSWSGTICHKCYWGPNVLRSTLCKRKFSARTGIVL